MHGGSDGEGAHLGGGGGDEGRGEARGQRAGGAHAAVGGERGAEVGGAVVRAEEGVPEEGVGAWGGGEGEGSEAGLPGRGVGRDELGGEVGAWGEAGGDGEGVETEQCGERRRRRQGGRGEEAVEECDRGRGLKRRTRRRHIGLPFALFKVQTSHSV